jgi:uncharacterized NAD-dependent epimerase/dehydratase family protein
MTHIDGFANGIAALPELIDVHERILSNVKPAKVAAVALDTSGLDAAAATRAIESTQRETGLPADDPVRNGGSTLWNAILATLAQTPKAQLTARA